MSSTTEHENVSRLYDGWWQVIRVDPFTYKRPTYDRYRTRIGEEEVTDPPNTVVGEHRVKATAEKHRDKCIRTSKPRKFAIRSLKGGGA